MVAKLGKNYEMQVSHDKKIPYYRVNSKISNVDDVKPSKMLAQGIISVNGTRLSRWKNANP